MINVRSFRILAAALAFALAAGIGPSRAQSPANPPVSGGAVDATLIDDLVIANRVLYDQGVLDGFGHVSVRHPTDPNRFLMSRSLAPGLVTAEDIMEYDLDGDPVDAKGRTSFLERFIHSEIYRARPDVKVVVHSHSPAVIPFGTTQAPMRPMYHVAAFLSPSVPVFEIRKAAGMTNMLIGDGTIGHALAEALGNHAVVLMRGHGNVIVGPTISLTVFRAVYTEINARVQAQAIAIGGPITFLEPEEAEKANKVLDQVNGRAWDLWKRKVLADMKK
jgi:ribulose-5-phosphate 4-epimerase/fuculose-1-phosphate aldolase